MNIDLTNVELESAGESKYLEAGIHTVTVKGIASTADDPSYSGKPYVTVLFKDDEDKETAPRFYIPEEHDRPTAKEFKLGRIKQLFESAGIDTSKKAVKFNDLMNKKLQVALRDEEYLFTDKETGVYEIRTARGKLWFTEKVDKDINDSNFNYLRTLKPEQAKLAGTLNPQYAATAPAKEEDDLPF